MPSDDDYRESFARRYDLSGITADLSKVPGKTLALAAALRPFKMTPIPESEVLGDPCVTDANIMAAEYLMAIFPFFCLKLVEGDRGLPRKYQADGPWVIGGDDR